MFSNKENVNILTALLVAHGVRHAVVCPGSRNAPLVHNLDACTQIACHPVTDERSAGFYALGMAQMTGHPVCVCVTSGTALLNLLPAVAEAYYQHVALIVVSADRPEAWIDQLDGQTLPQPDALGRFVAMAVGMPEPHTAEDRWLCNRRANEALCEARRRRCPVHINVPIAEPLFEFDVAELPIERTISFVEPRLWHEDVVACGLLGDFCRARQPMIVVGQRPPGEPAFIAALRRLRVHAVVLSEALGNDAGGANFDEVLSRLGVDAEQYAPDFLLYLGDTIVSKRLRRFLRCDIQSVWEVSEDGRVHDTFQHVQGVVCGQASVVLEALCMAVEDGHVEHDGIQSQLQDTSAYVGLWREALKQQARRCDTFVPSYSQMAAVRQFEALLADGVGGSCSCVHYANSSAVRLANIYARHHVCCNRGVNGIEGSLSAAAGASLLTDGRVYCVVGDLSFFYDQNALWQQELRGNLRIVLLNNGGGGIFSQLSGLEHSPARDRLVAACHTTSAEGICRQNGVGYRAVHSDNELHDGLLHLLTDTSARPMLLEVFTDAACDARALAVYYKTPDPQTRTVELSPCGTAPAAAG